MNNGGVAEWSKALNCKFSFSRVRIPSPPPYTTVAYWMSSGFLLRPKQVRFLPVVIAQEDLRRIANA